MTGKIKTVVFAEGVEVTPSSYIDIVDADGVQTLTNKNLSDSTTNIVDVSDATKKIGFDAGGTTGTKTTIAASQTANRTVTLPDQTTTLVGRATTDTLENKTLTSPQVNSGVLLTPNIDDYFDINEEAEPSSPSSGKVRVFAKNDKKVYKKDSNGAVTEIGSGGAGGINYISNYDAETGTTTGWATYADAAATTPVDGTGGSPNITFTASTSSPLRGTYNFLITKDAANRQGQGVSYDFTIAAADKGLPLGISWEGEASANYTGSTGSEYMVVYIYDVTNATLIATSNVNVAAGSSKGFTTFLATTSTSYRLIFHVAGTGTSSWTYKLDSISVSPEIAIQGLAGQDYQSCTFTGSWVSNTTYNAKYRRVGDTAEFDVNLVLAGAPTSAALTLTLPTGMTIDTSKLAPGADTANSSLGIVSIFDTSATAIYQGVVAYATTTSVYINVEKSDGTYGTLQTGVTQAVPVTFASGDEIYIKFSVPIVGWSSNVTMANRAVEEYAADDGSSDVFGADGALVPNQTATTGTTDRSFSFNGTASATDLLIVEIKESSTGNWTPATQLYPFSSGNNAGATNFYGIRGAWTSSTVYRVQFGNQGDRVSSSSSSAGATPWSTLYSAGARFRVRKVSGGAVVGYPIGARNIVGDTTGTTVPGGYIGERLTSSGSATAWTSGQYMDGGNAGLTLTPGVWLIKSQHVYTLGGDTAISEYTYGVGTASGNSATGLTEYITHRNAANNPAGNQRFVSPTTYVNISASTTYYPKFYLVGTRSAGTVTSSLEAVRIA